MKRAGTARRFLGAGKQWATVISLTVLASCEPPPDEAQAPEDITPVEQAATSYPQIDFSSTPSYLGPKDVVLTFDDVPDDTNTPKVLDTLKSNNVKACFFINTNNFTNVATDTTAQAIIKRMVNEGHEIGNHTVDHPDLATLTTTQIESEIAGVENTLKSIVGSRRLTLLRAPYGSPYVGGTSTQINKVAPIVAKHAVHIGWHIDSLDSSTYENSSSGIINTVEGELKKGHYGIILMHATHPATASALPTIISYLKSNGYVFKRVEDVVRARYGATTASAEQVDNLLSHVNRGATADAYVYDGSPATNYGTAVTLDVKTSSAGYNRDAYLRFDISTVSTITKAKLRIFAAASGTNSGDMNLGVYSIAATPAWTETGLTWSTRPALVSSLKTVKVVGTSLAAYDLDVTTFVKNAKSASQATVDLALHFGSSLSPVVHVNSRQNANSRPQLVITP